MTIVIILIAIALVGLLSLMVMRLIMKSSYGRIPRAEHTYKYYYDHYEKEYPRKRVTVPCSPKDLAAFIYGAQNTKALVVLSHGSGAFHEDYMTDIIWFVNHGYRVFAADYSGSGYTEGDNAGGLPKTPIDLDKVLTYIEQDEELGKLKKVLYGHSWGAYGVTAVLNYKHDVKAVVSIAAYNEPAEQLADILARTISPVIRITQPLFWLNDRMDYGKYGTLTAVGGINKSNVPVLVVEAERDEMISYNKCAISAHKKKIKNPNVSYLLFDEKGYDNHDSFFFIREAYELVKEVRIKDGQIKAAYEGDELDRELRKLYNEVDKDLMNAPNEEFMFKVDAFYEENLSRQQM